MEKCKGIKENFEKEGHWEQKVRKTMISSNKACKWSFSSNILLLYMNTVCSSILAKVFSTPPWAPCQTATYWQFYGGFTCAAAHPHHCCVRHPQRGHHLGPRTKAAICPWWFAYSAGTTLSPPSVCAFMPWALGEFHKHWVPSSFPAVPHESKPPAGLLCCSWTVLSYFPPVSSPNWHRTSLGMSLDLILPALK